MSILLTLWKWGPMPLVPMKMSRHLDRQIGYDMSLPTYHFFLFKTMFLKKKEITLVSFNKPKIFFYKFIIFKIRSLNCWKLEHFTNPLKMRTQYLPMKHYGNVRLLKLFASNVWQIYIFSRKSSFKKLEASNLKYC